MQFGQPGEYPDYEGLSILEPYLVSALSDLIATWYDRSLALISNDVGSSCEWKNGAAPVSHPSVETCRVRSSHPP
jgi:hypothetical protein